MDEADHTGKLSCLRAGISTFLPLSIPSARASRLRVARGMITPYGSHRNRPSPFE